MSDLKLRIATRKSALALAQTTMAADAIVAANAAAESLTYELVSMTTEGDRRLDKSLASFGGKGVFIKELEIALLEDRADIAIHSLKDMPAEVLPQFKLAAVLKREDPRDAFLSRGGANGVHFMDLPVGARIGTGSIRRVVQLKALRPDLEYVPIRGNIQTRIGKLAELDGVVLAAAGLKRMGLADQVTEYFSTEQMLPASGQGILAIETLNDATVQESRVTGRADLAQILARVNDVATYCIASAEMAYLKALNAGCQFPVASFAEFVCDDSVEDRGTCGALEENAQTLKIRGIYWDEKSNRLLRAETSGALDLNSADSVHQAKNLGVELACAIQKQL
ncbi:hydroxymethylbilane synthase [uncultured Fibrobacter sp.]|uniref:hydroxymethylbilane synthase n=1 Tax=uncultured Fibrobacter sp. TaxID=261512 RepID=UPI0025EDE207|nr:hydroxymethylbilane synthase [uncultured Fibrobacter sp.]